MALIHAELGERETAAALVEQLAAPGLRKFRHDMLFLPSLTFLTLVCADLDDSTHAEEIYDLLRPYTGRVVVVGAPANACWGPVDHYLGVLAALCHRPEWAVDHFESPLTPAARLGTPALLAETRLEFANALLAIEHRLPRPGDHVARRAARRSASALGLQRMIDRLRPPLRSGIEPSERRPRRRRTTAAGTPRCSLRRDGEFWTVMTPRGSTHVRDAKGVQHLATLLAQPGRPSTCSTSLGEGRTMAYPHDRTCPTPRRRRRVRRWLRRRGRRARRHRQRGLSTTACRARRADRRGTAIQRHRAGFAARRRARPARRAAHPGGRSRWSRSARGFGERTGEGQRHAGDSQRHPADR